MKGNNKLTLKCNALRDGSTKCKCGHTMTIPAFKDTAICTWCGKRIKNKSKDHFKYTINKMLKK